MARAARAPYMCLINNSSGRAVPRIDFPFYFSGVASAVNKSILAPDSRTVKHPARGLHAARARPLRLSHVRRRKRTHPVRPRAPAGRAFAAGESVFSDLVHETWATI
ncbi:hypothetical protein EVAR_57373_1 [Eumeta japonica]|uniref:Uncharacterized protein n=1 Tax=Eumeta variegata TaxID=151549 RepID=A0A4C1ZFQ6_EUMVA|nr:hypothetical protein EVAR_57373_1 [Eumeta japonica]